LNGENIGKLTPLVDEPSGSAAGAATAAALCCSNSRVECQAGARQVPRRWQCYVVQTQEVECQAGARQVGTIARQE